MSCENPFSLKGKNAVVIGGCRGLGKGIAMGLAQAGANVIISSRTQSDCEAAAFDIQKGTGRQAYGIAADITKTASISSLVDKACECLGGIHILVNSAGINVRKPALEFTEQDWDTVQNVQLKGVFFACQLFAEHMINKKISGRIINIASVNSKVVARPHIVPYVAAKGGVMQMTKALALEWAEYGITVNAIAPGWFQTELTQVIFDDPLVKNEILLHIPQKQFGNPDKDLAGIAVYFASDASSYTTGQMICIDGGYTTI